VDARSHSRTLRRAGTVGALTLGFAMFGAGVHGLAGVDARLEAATERQRQAVPVNDDCPREGYRDRAIDRERL
jgi:hypothetical protein